MRRLVVVPVLAALLVVSACSSGDAAPRRTVTVVNTVTGSADASVPASAATGSESSAPSAAVTDPSAPASATGSAVDTGSVAPSGGTSAADTASASAPPSATPTFVKLDPLTVDCGGLLNATDIQKALNVDVPANYYYSKDVANPEIGVTGKTRCSYGNDDDKGTNGRIRVALTQYTDAAAMASQVAVTLKTYADMGSAATPVTVADFPASLIVGQSLIIVPYDTWSLTLVSADGLVGADLVTTGLPTLANQIILRMQKNG